MDKPSFTRILKPIRDSSGRVCRNSGRKADERKTRDKEDSFVWWVERALFQVYSLRSLSLMVGEE